MFHKNTVRTNELKIGSDCSVTLKYYLLKLPSESLLANEAVNGVTYGVLIEKLEKNSENNSENNTTVVEMEMVSAFTYVLEEAFAIIHILADNYVTPSSLLYIIDDYISSDRCAKIPLEHQDMNTEWVVAGLQ